MIRAKQHGFQVEIVADQLRLTNCERIERPATVQLASGSSMSGPSGGGMLAMPASLMSQTPSGVPSQHQMVAMVMEKTRLKEHAAKELLGMCQFNVEETLRMFQQFQHEGRILPESLQ